MRLATVSAVQSAALLASGVRGYSMRVPNMGPPMRWPRSTACILSTPNRRAAGAGCALNDVWLHDLQTLLWVQLSEPHFATPECKRMFT